MQTSTADSIDTVIRGRVRRDNLPFVLECIADQIGYILSDLEIEVLAFEASLATSDNHYTYEFAAAEPLMMAVSLADESLFIDVAVSRCSPASGSYIAMALAFFEHFDVAKPFCGLEPVMRKTFQAGPRPDARALLSCSYEHLATCEECQEAHDTFSRHDWTDVMDDGWEPPRGFADLSLLAADAKLYFLPAYVAMAIKARSGEILSWAVGSLQVAGQQLEPAQTAFVALVGSRRRPLADL